MLRVMTTAIDLALIWLEVGGLLAEFGSGLVDEWDEDDYIYRSGPRSTAADMNDLAKFFIDLLRREFPKLHRTNTQMEPAVFEARKWFGRGLPTSNMMEWHPDIAGRFVVNERV
jgi:hypothetical protein